MISHLSIFLVWVFCVHRSSWSSMWRPASAPIFNHWKTGTFSNKYTEKCLLYKLHRPFLFNRRQFSIPSFVNKSACEPKSHHREGPVSFLQSRALDPLIWTSKNIKKLFKESLDPENIWRKVFDKTVFNSSEILLMCATSYMMRSLLRLVFVSWCQDTVLHASDCTDLSEKETLTHVSCKMPSF